MLKAYCDKGVFQKVILISPTAAYDAKYKMLPLTAVHEDYSDGLINRSCEARYVYGQKDAEQCCRHLAQHTRLDAFLPYVPGSTLW